MPVKLRPDQVRQIRRLFDDRAGAMAGGRPMPLTLAELGRLFGVSRSTAYRVGLRLSHEYVDDDVEGLGRG